MTETRLIRSVLLSSTQWATLGKKLSDPFFARLACTNKDAMRLYDASRGKTLVDVPGDLAVSGSPRPPGLSYRPIKGRLLRAAVALHAGGDEGAWPFASETIDFLLQRDFWRPNSFGCRIRHYDLKMGDLLFSACLALEAFETRLDPARKERLLELIIEEGIATYLRGWEAQEWWRTAEFNWGAATHGTAGLAALALAEIEPDLSRRLLEHVRSGLKTVIDYLPQDGWWSEGAMYQTTTLAHLSDFVIALERLEGDDLGLSKNPRWIEALETRAYALAPDGGIFNFSNCPTRKTEVYLPQVYWWAERLNRPEWIVFEDSICKKWSDTKGVFHDIEAFLHRPANPELPPPARLAPLRHFRGLDWLTWRGPRTWLAFRSGNNGGNHNHLDLGHFILGQDATRFLADPGYGATQTGQHNAVSIRGKSHADASTAAIIQHGECGGGFYLGCDLGACFPYILERHFRWLILVEDAHLFVVDDLRGRDGIRVSAKYHFHTPLEVTHQPGGCRIGAGTGSLDIISLTNHVAPEFTPWRGQEGGLTEIGFYVQADLPEELSVFRLSFNGSPAPELRLDDDRRTITICHGEHSIALDLARRRIHAGGTNAGTP